MDENVEINEGGEPSIAEVQDDTHLKKGQNGSQKDNFFNTNQSASNSSQSKWNDGVTHGKPNYDSMGHFELPLFRKWLRILTPFHIQQKKRSQPDGFYFPQSFIAGVTLSFVTLIFMSVQCFSYLTGFITSA